MCYEENKAADSRGGSCATEEIRQLIPGGLVRDGGNKAADFRGASCAMKEIRRLISEGLRAL